jgi:hypothetical protein
MIITTQDILANDFGLTIDVYNDDTNKQIGFVHLDIVENDTTKKLELVVMSDSHKTEDTQQ